MDTGVKRKVSVLAKNNSIGDRLLEAFGTSDKEFIAKILGFETKRAIYKVLSGERELDFDKLVRFQSYTKCSLDWLLTGEGVKFVSRSATPLPGISDELFSKLQSIAQEQSQHVFAGSDIVGENGEARTLEVLIGYFLNRALQDYNLLADDQWLISKGDQANAERLTFIRERQPSIEERFREIVIAELDRHRPDTIEQPSNVHYLGVVDEFDIRAAVERYDDPTLVMRDWYAFDRIPEMPEVVRPSGWDKLSIDERVSEIQGLRSIMDRQRERKRHASTKLKRA